MAGYVCGTCCQGSELTHESMTEHDASGQTLCIHSVVVSDKFRRRGYATALLKVLDVQNCYSLSFSTSLTISTIVWITSALYSKQQCRRIARAC